MGRWATCIALCGLLVAHAALLAWSSCHQAVTYDEAAHLAAGCAYWSRGEMGLYSHSPPLLRYWGALPVVLMRPNLPDTQEFADRDIFIRHFDFGRAFAQANRARFPGMVVAGRLGMIPLLCAGLLIVFVWARSLWGPAAGIGAATLWAFEPNILAHGSLIGTDAGTAVFCLLAAWCWWRFFQRPTRRRGITADLALAGATLCKFSALLLWPAIYVLRIAAEARAGRRFSKPLSRGILGAILITYLAICVAYQFRHFGVRTGTPDFYSRTMLAVRRALPRSTWLPVPEDLVTGFDVQMYESDVPGVSLLFGQRYAGSRAVPRAIAMWEYWPVAFACKLPPELLLLIVAGTVVGLGWCVRHRRWPPLRHWAWLLPGAALASLALQTQLEIGIRYVLPAFGFLFVALGGLLGLMFARRGWRWVAVALLLGMALETLWQAPRFLTYASPLVGGPRTSWQKVLVDFDWGQGIGELADWQHRTSSGRIGIAILTSTDPGIYGLDALPIDRLTDERFVAVSTYFLDGLLKRIPRPGGQMPRYLQAVYAWRQLWPVKPVFIADDCIYIYRRADYDAAVKTEQQH